MDYRQRPIGFVVNDGPEAGHSSQVSTGANKENHKGGDAVKVRHVHHGLPISKQRKFTHLRRELPRGYDINNLPYIVTKKKNTFQEVSVLYHKHVYSVNVLKKWKSVKYIYHKETSIPRRFFG